ncbi:hypothetical protein [Variovorax sp. PvP013]|uniref:hypothetical protein n=1 Tax=Variovorax sp. PvP013 TaxID=3156435 RepID=UPI003D1C75A4
MSVEHAGVADGQIQMKSIFLHGEEGTKMAVMLIVRVMTLVYGLMDHTGTLPYRLRILGIDQDFEAQRRRMQAILDGLDSA